MISDENRVINGLWIGSKLSSLELLTLHSFVHHGHQFHLWTYGPLETDIPDGVVIMDANNIIPKQKVFRYKNSNQFGHGKGSVAGFSDIFRYKLLFEKGGWWVDMDVTCLRPFTTSQPYYFRAHHELSVVGNVMKCPKESRIMQICYTLANETVTDQNQDWNLPIRILNDQLELLKLSKYVVYGDSPPDQWHMIKKWLFSRKSLDKDYVFVHWLNEVWRVKNIDSESLLASSYFGQLLHQYQIQPKKQHLLKVYLQLVRYRWH